MSRVRSLEFTAYKAFSRFSISARERNILVGPNNAGKSTTLDAFRIAFDVLRFASRRNAVLKSQGTDGVCATWMVPVSAVQIDLRSCVHNFDEGRARISIRLENGNSLELLIPSDGDLECYLRTELTARKNTNFLKDQFPLRLTIVPTLSPLEQNEELVQQETVERNRYGRLASRNFRNFWLHKTQSEFDTFSDLVEFGWPGIKVFRPEIEQGGPRPIVRMYFRDGSRVREVQWAGFGFQVWMQTMMHLSSADSSSTLVLDEPDIYLHPDLQHRLLRLISKKVEQYFIATHSTEIINDADAGDVLIVRPESRGAKRISNEAGYFDVYSAIGSSENAQFARLAKTKKVLYFEGKDSRLLSKVSKRLGSVDLLSDDSVTIMKTDGFANWTRVSTSSWVFEKFFGLKIPVAAIFDRDYRSDEEVLSFLNEVNSGDTLCAVLPFKEIENLLLVSSAIKAAVQKHYAGELSATWEADVSQIIDASLEGVKSKTLSARIGSRINFEVSKAGRKDIPTISAMEEKAFTQGWTNGEFKRKVVPGKEVLSNISSRIQEKFSVTLTPSRIVDHITVADIDPSFFTILRDVKAHLGD